MTYTYVSFHWLNLYNYNHISFCEIVFAFSGSIGITFCVFNVVLNSSVCVSLLNSILLIQPNLLDVQVRRVRQFLLLISAFITVQSLYVYLIFFVTSTLVVVCNVVSLLTERQSAQMSKIKTSGLDQYGDEPFEQQQF